MNAYALRNVSDSRPCPDMRVRESLRRGRNPRQLRHKRVNKDHELVRCCGGNRTGGKVCGLIQPGCEDGKGLQNIRLSVRRQLAGCPPGQAPELR